MPTKAAVKRLKADQYPKGEITKLWLHLYQDATGRPVGITIASCAYSSSSVS